MKLWMDNSGGIYEARPDEIEVRGFKFGDEAEIHYLMGRYECGAFKALQILREEIAVWDAHEFFGNLSDEELGLTAESDLWEVEARLKSLFPSEELGGCGGPVIPLEILNLREFLRERQEEI